MCESVSLIFSSDRKSSSLITFRLFRHFHPTWTTEQVYLFDFIRNKNMFVAITTVFLLAIYQCQCLMNATVTLHPPDSPLNIGRLVFTQQSPDSPVQINGTIFGLNPISTHVRSKDKILAINSSLSGFSYSYRSSRRRFAQLYCGW